MATKQLSPTDGSGNLQTTAVLNDPVDAAASEVHATAVLAAPGQRLPVDISAYRHAFRRHWWAAVIAGAICATVLGPAAWYRIGPKYTATLYLRASMQDKPLVAFASDGNGGWIDRDRFDIYKSTQQQYLVSRLVMLAALRNPAVAQLPAVQQQRAGDPAAWLAQQVLVNFPGKAEIIEVSVRRRNPQEAAALASAVVDAYLAEVVNAERNQNQQRLAELDELCLEKETEVRAKRTELKNLAEGLGAAETETLTLKQKLALEELTIYRQEMAKIQVEIRRLHSDLAAQEAVLKSLATAEIPAAEIDALVMNDPVGRQLFIELGFKKMDQAYTDMVAVPATQSRFAERYRDEAAMLQKQYDARITALREDIREKKRAAVETEIARLRTAVTVMQQQERTMADNVAKQQKLAEQFGNSSIDIEMLRADIKHLESALAEMAGERERLKVADRAASRVTLLPPAEPAVKESNRTNRLALTAFVMLIGFCVPGGWLTLRDARVQRINGCEEVSRRLRLPVIGVLPRLSPAVAQHLDGSSAACRDGRIRVQEAVDGVVARLLHKADQEAGRVLMVTSAVAGEGKTMLAAQLAQSLARTGRRTVLVDFDLRRPACHTAFQRPLTPGVGDVLHDPALAEHAVQATAIENLSLITAGQHDRLAVAALANGALPQVLQTLRERFDFVVLDTSPLVPVADARFLVPYADTVVLAVFVDVSELPKVRAASEILEAFGAPAVDAVVIGANDRIYSECMEYHPTYAT